VNVRRRGVSVGPQGPDGMSRLSGWLNPGLRVWSLGIEPQGPLRAVI
jgi:hypothetical protein